MTRVGRGFTPRHPSTDARALSNVEGQAGREGPPYGYETGSTRVLRDLRALRASVSESHQREAA